MTEQRKPPGYVDQTATTLPTMQAQHPELPPVRKRAPSLSREDPPEPSLAEVMGAIKTLSHNLHDLTKKVEDESLKSAGDRSLTNAAIHVLQQDVASVKAGPLRLPTIPPPSAMVPARDPMTSTGQHAIVVAQAALQGVDALAQAQAAASVDYAREQERATAEMFAHLSAMAKEARAGFGKWVAIGGTVFSILSAIGGYATTRLANKDVAHDTAAEVSKELPKLQPAPMPSGAP